MLKFQVRNLARAEGLAKQPSWTAELVAGDVRVPVDRHSGSWIARLPEGSRHLPFALAERLQEKVRPTEKAERKAREAAAAAAKAEGVAA